MIRVALALFWLAATTWAAPPNVVLITLDTVRADRMGFLGSQRGLTPNLDALARQSVVFTRAYSQVPLTTASHATILTGTYPQYHKVNDFQIPLAEDLPYAPQVFRGAGYSTAAFVASVVLDPRQQFARGFDRGFDKYDAGFKDWKPSLDRYQTRERRAGSVVSRAVAWLNTRPKGPFFLWVHLYDAHYPYDPPPPYKSKYASAPYDGEIAYVDAELARLFAALRARGLFDSSVVAVMADHGEALGDHGEDTHGIFLYDETIRVPLMIKLPGQASAGKSIENRVGLVDVAPTLLGAAGVAVPKEMQGLSLLGMMLPESAKGGSVSDAAATRAVYSESDYPRVAFGWSSLQALRSGKYLYVEAPHAELYDQSADPKAERNLYAASTGVASTLAGQLKEFEKKTTSSREIPKLNLDPVAQAKLAALGYVASGSNNTKGTAQGQRPDPKDKIEIGNQLHKANYLIESQRYQDAIPLLQRLSAKEPGMPLPFSQLATCLLATQKYAEAVPVLRKLVELNPEPPVPHFELAIALLSTDDIPGAVTELQSVVEKVPQWTSARLMLATAYFQTNHMREAVTECEIVLETAPELYEALILEGRALVASQHYEAALPKLAKAATLQPDMAEPHSLLAEAYEKLDKKAEADAELARAKRLEPRSPR